MAVASDDHEKNVRVKAEDKPPQFYENYANDILEIIKCNADCEFKIIWEQMLMGRPHGHDRSAVWQD